jgi:glucose-6-phosphate 1-dehydrogenase
MAEQFGVQGRGAFYEQVGAIRDVVQNHLLQIVAHLAMEPPASNDSESIRDEKVKVLKCIVPLDPSHVIRLPIRAWRHSPRSAWRLTRGDGRACRSCSVPASACR